MHVVDHSKALKFQRREITEYHIYKHLASAVKLKENQNILNKLSLQERRHYETWKKITGRDVDPSRFLILFYSILTKIFGLSFGLRLMEAGERKAQMVYSELEHIYPDIIEIIKDEQEHEKHLLSLINDRFLNYVSSVILGLNDALVELSGALAGLTFALEDSRLIAVVGAITGIAAAFSMGASEYLSSKEEEAMHKNPYYAGIITGITYFLTVILLISPYFWLDNPWAAFLITISSSFALVLFFTFYIAVARQLSFRKRFLEMFILSSSAALLNFLIGYLIKKYFGLSV